MRHAGPGLAVVATLLMNSAGGSAAEEAASLTLEQVDAFIRRFYDPGLFTMLALRPE